MFNQRDTKDPNELPSLSNITKYAVAYFTGDCKLMPRYIAPIIESHPESKVQLNITVIHQLLPLVDAVSNMILTF